MSTAPSPQDSTSRRSVLGLARDTYLSAKTIRQAHQQGWNVYWPAEAESGVLDCTVYKPGRFGNTAPGLISVWDAE